MDRRSAFFLVAAVACFLLVPLAEREYRGIAAGLGVVYVVLAFLSFLDDRGRSRSDGPTGSGRS